VLVVITLLTLRGIDYDFGDEGRIDEVLGIVARVNR